MREHGDCMSALDDHLIAGREALARAAWQEAESSFEPSPEAEETPEVLAGLGMAASWLSDGETWLDAAERAYGLCRRRRAARDAARMAFFVAVTTYDFRGELAVTNGSLERPRRPLEGLEPGAEQALVALLDVGGRCGSCGLRSGLR